MKINHKTIVQQQNNPSYEVSRNAWNAVHDMIVGAAKLVGNSTASTGSAEEISVGANLTLAAGVLSAASAPTAFGSIKVTTFTSSGTYTPDANLVAGYAICKGGGGGGGGAAVTPSNSTGAAGGAEGNTAIKWFKPADVSGGLAVTVGAGGSGGFGSPGTGGVGGSSSLGTICVATGGGGGSQFTSGLATGGSVGDVILYGATGGQGMQGTVASSAVAAPGNGGGAGGGIGIMDGTSGTFNTGGNGIANSGGGGAGGSSYGAGPGNISGGTGGSGFVYVVEYLSA